MLSSWLLIFMQKKCLIRQVCHSDCLWSMRPKVHRTSKDQGKEGVEFLSLFRVLCDQICCLIQQCARIFPCCTFASNVVVEARVALRVPCQSQLQVGSGYPNPIPASLNNASIFFLGHLSLLPPLILLLLNVWVNWEHLVHPSRPSATFAWFSAHWDLFWAWRRWTLKVNITETEMNTFPFQLASFFFFS